MIYSYSLTAKQARICRVAAGLFLAVAALQAGALLFSIAMPNMSLRWQCGSGGCVTAVVPDLGLTSDQLAAAGVGPGDPAGPLAGLGRPEVRLAQAVLEAMAQLPLAALLLCIALALWRLSRRSGDDLALGIPWLFRASICTLLYALLPPLAQIGRSSLLLSAIGSEWIFWAELDLKALLMNLLLASVAFTATWALAAGNRARRDIAEIV